jgi:hypothetical protein
MSYGTVQAEKMTTESGYSLGAGNASSFKNRIINGAMVIDQRNAGAAVAITGSEVYSVDRFLARFSAGSGSSTQGQSSVAPAGFKNSLLINVTTGGTVTAAVRGLVSQRIEGYNWADLGYGAAGAASSTLSFWVRSSLTGTFSGALQNNAGDRSYAFTYTISAANTWEYKTIAVSGDTSGTWLTTNGGGISIGWDLGNGSDIKTATTGSWLAGDFRGVTGSVAPFATSGSTWYITGVQLEVGTVATSFDYRSISTELQLCQRYFEKSYQQDTAIGTNTTNGAFEANNSSYGNSVAYGPPVFYKVIKRATPTVTGYTYSGTSGQWHYARSGVSETAATFQASISCDSQFAPRLSVGAGWVPCYVIGQWTASAEL